MRARIFFFVLVVLSTTAAAVEPLSPSVVRRLGPVYAGQHALVTGGSSGIGLAIGCHLAQLGAHVTLLARDETKLREAMRVLAVCSANATQKFDSIAVDVTDRDGLRQALMRLTDSGAPVDILVNNAGMSHPSLTEDLTDAAVDGLIATNLRAPIDITRYFLYRFKGRRTGKIAFVASLAGAVNIAGYSLYGATKAGLVAFADTVRHELSPTEVTVSVVLPPDVATPMLVAENKIKPRVTKELSGEPIAPESVSEALLEGMARGRFEIVPTWHGWFVRWMARVLPGCVRAMIDPVMKKHEHD